MLLALDFGGTKLTAVTLPKTSLTHPSPRWLAKKHLFAPPDADAASDIRMMIALGRELLAGKRPAAVGVSFGGPTDFATGCVIRSDHVPGWENVALRDRLEKEFETAVQIDNDANCGALGEHRFGAGRGCQNMLYITISTGVGGGWILNGTPWRGINHMAGEIGHMVVDPQGLRCLCGKRGCVERYASGPYMAQDAREMLDTSPGTRSVLREMGEITGKGIATAVSQGDKFATEILLRGAWALGFAIGNTANLMNIERFVLGGGVTKSGPQWWDTVRRVARETALADMQFEVVPAVLGDDAPLWGAVGLDHGLLRKKQVSLV